MKEGHNTFFFVFFEKVISYMEGLAECFLDLCQKKKGQAYMQTTYIIIVLCLSIIEKTNIVIKMDITYLNYELF